MTDTHIIGIVKCIVIFSSIQLGSFGAIVDEGLIEHHGVSDNTRNGWKLTIHPQQTQPNINILLKRVDDTLNLTCKIEMVETTKYNNNSILNNEEYPNDDQTFRLSWYLPFGLENSKNRVYNFESHNSLQLMVENLREADSGEYKCQTETLSEAHSSNPYIHASSVILRVKPKKGSCSEPLFSCGSGECIAKRYICDGKKDCKNNDDESQQQCGTWNPCEGKLRCEDGRCISSNWCCDRSVDKNCTVRSVPKCCLQLHSIQVNLDVNQYSPQPQHYNDMGFLQTTIYTVIGCAMAFMFIITIMVIAICRVHLKRTALARYPHLARAGAGQRQDSWGNIFLHPPGLPFTPAPSGLLVTYNINNGIQFLGNRPLHPPPYSEIIRIPPREGPPPPYDSRENISTIASSTLSSASANPPNQSVLDRNIVNLRRTEYSQEDRSGEPTPLEPLLNNDNNNGDINGNSTEAVAVEPNRNDQNHL